LWDRGGVADVKQLRRWWRGPLDVEGLALDAVGRVCAATQQAAAARGLSVTVSTTPELVAASFAAFEHLRVAGRAPQAWAPFSGFFEAGDGWVRLHGNYPHHAAAVTTALGAGTKDELIATAKDLAAADIEQRVTDAGGIATVVRTERGWAEHLHGRATAGTPWHATRVGAPRRTLPPQQDGLPLEGVRVLDLTRVIAGPTCSQVLACLGADVLRIDPPQAPELIDQYLSNGMGKRSAEVDLATDAETLWRELLPEADVLLLGYRPGALAKYGLDADTVAADHPGLVVGSLSAWGEEGPWRDRRGFDSIVQAATGIADVCASADRPGALPVQALDHATGHILAAELISLLARGSGGVVRASLLGAARVLLARPRSIAAEVTLEAPTVTVDSPYGPLVTVPPPVLLDGRHLVAEVTGYGASRPTWA
jgi:crotonobetainyl-CoA:carnitine CoA-transferase CaiB-like acyl-CoA transferase